MSRPVLLLLILTASGCLQPRAMPPQPVQASPTPGPETKRTCDDVEFTVLPGQWPDPQFVDLGESALFGGGWSSISTGRFGSASWEHCETLTLIAAVPGPLPAQYAALAGHEDRHACRIPDGVVGGKLFDFHWFHESLPGHDRDTVKEKFGWAPRIALADSFYFDSLDLWTGSTWVRHGFPRDGFYPGSVHVVVGPDLLLAGGYRKHTTGEHDSVAQSALFESSTGQWSYLPTLTRARHHHLMVAFDEGALAIGGVDAGGAVEVVERFDHAARQWHLHQLGPPIGHPMGAVFDGTVVVIEQVDPDVPISKFARIDPREKTWTWLASPQSPVLADFAPSSLLPHHNGPVLVTPERIERYDVTVDVWETCDVSRELDERPISGKGMGTWGPAHMMEDGRIFVSRIDRERYYDFEE